MYMKRQRGRGRKPGGGHHHNNHNNPNRAMESNGPDNTKVRGPAALVYERYQQYARDAASSGDRVLSENYLQHADHYYRLLRMMQPAAPVHQVNDRLDGDADFDAEDDVAMAEGETVEARSEPEASDEGGSEEQTAEQRGDGEFRRRRGRRNRFRPGGEGGDGESDGGAEARDGARGDRQERADRGERLDRPERRERAPRERARDNDQEPGEGFSNGPRPAFLGSD
jgi:hypothetical protein